MLARLQANAAAAAADTTHDTSRLDALRRAQRDRWRAEQASSPGRGEEDGGRRGNLSNAASRPVRSESSDEGGARPGAQRDAPARAEASRASQMDGRGDGGPSRGLVFGAALSAGLLGYRATRALHDLFRTEISSGPEEEERRRKRAQEAADAALAARLQREEHEALAREQASRARPRPPTDAFVTRREISLGPFGVVRVETTSSSGDEHSSPSASSAHRNAFADDPTSELDAPFAAALGEALRAHSRAFAARPQTAQTPREGVPGAGFSEWLAHHGFFDAFRGLESLESLESLLETLRGEGAGQPRESGAGDDALARMPTRVFSKSNARRVSSRDGCADPSDPLPETPTCAICMCDAQEGDALRRLPCRHEFHRTCVDRWLADHRTCPMCKSDVVEGLAREAERGA